MLKFETFELYVDYLIAHRGQVSAVDLSELLGHSLSHDHITRMLAQRELDQKEFWRLVKPSVRQIERDDGCIVVDDFIVEKPHSTANSIITSNWDHAQQRYVLGIHVLNFLYTVGSKTESINLPLAFEVISKTEAYVDPKTGKQKMKSAKTKNELLRERLKVLCYHNQVKFRYVLWDSWFSSVDNILFVVQDLKKHFIGALKDNRKVAMVDANGKLGAFRSASEQEIRPGDVYKVRLEKVPFDLFLTKRVYQKQDGSTGVVLLVCSDGDLDSQTIFHIYHKRWKVEEAHKSVKQNLGIARSCTKMERSQKNHLFAAMFGLLQLEKLKITHRLNHFALKQKIYMAALKAAWAQTMELKSRNVKELNYASF